MKPQTFNEWCLSQGFIEKHMAHGVAYAMRLCWQAAMENAARICEEQRIGIDAFGSIDYHVGSMQSQCAEAIREAAKR